MDPKILQLPELEKVLPFVSLHIRECSLMTLEGGGGGGGDFLANGYLAKLSIPDIQYIF